MTSSEDEKTDSPNVPNQETSGWPEDNKDGNISTDPDSESIDSTSVKTFSTINSQESDQEALTKKQELNKKRDYIKSYFKHRIDDEGDRRWRRLNYEDGFLTMDGLVAPLEDRIVQEIPHQSHKSIAFVWSEREREFVKTPFTEERIGDMIGQ